MKKTLLILTTANQIEYTIKAVASYNRAAPEGVELLIIDDASTDGTPEYCRENGIRCITKPDSKGVTHSWNLGYHLFKESAYDFLILANNDILIPKGAIENFLKILNEHVIAGVLSNESGVPFDKGQSLNYNYKIRNLGFDPALPGNFQKVQDWLQQKTLKTEYKKVLKVNGFFFGFNRSICKFELDEKTLFSPDLINVKNEFELCLRVKYNIAVSLRSFIFHFKGVSFIDHEIDANYDYGRQLTWKEARQLKKSRIRRIIHRVKAKLN